MLVPALLAAGAVAAAAVVWSASTVRECRSCAAREGDGAEIPPRSRLCLDCTREAAREGLPDPTPARSRRTYRAALRHRTQSPQPDLIDLITPIPGGPL